MRYPVKHFHEIKDPIHVFIRHDNTERDVINSEPIQRLRYIHQLSLAYLVYPGATHRRFEHSLGVMELAGRVFDVITSREKLNDGVRALLEEIEDHDKLSYWRRVTRMAALCHDIGHLPFSHVAEAELLPEGWDHERLTRILIESPAMGNLWSSMRPPLLPADIVKVAVGKKGAKDLEFSDWETILSEIIVGDAFGVDRMDYLLRDGYHTGVSFSRFDHTRLIDCLRILPPPKAGEEMDESIEPALGVEFGGLSSAEALLLARYFMFSQVYFHPVCRIYSKHLTEFLAEALPNKKFPTTALEHLKWTDNEVTSLLLEASRESGRAGHDRAERLVKRQHFRVLYQWNPVDARISPEITNVIYTKAVEKYNSDKCRFDSLPAKGAPPDFRVLMKDGRVESAMAVSRILKDIPVQKQEYVFIDPALRAEAGAWVADLRQTILREAEENENDGKRK